MDDPPDRNRAYIDATPAAMFVVDMLERIVDLNPAGVELLGGTREELLGSTFTQFVHADDRARALDEFAQLADAPTVSTQVRLVNRRGELHWIDVRATRLDDGHVVGFCQDIAPLKATERELRERADRLAMALDAGRIVSWEFNTATGVSHREGPIAEVFDGALAPSGSASDFLAHLAPADRATIEDALRRLADEGGEFTHEVPLELRPGEPPRWFRLSGRASRGASDGHRSIVGVAIDLTERKLAEQRALDAQARLEGMIASAHEGILSIDASQRIVLVNPAAATLFGYEADALIGASIDRLLPTVFIAKHREDVERFLSSGESVRRSGQMLIQGLRHDGAPISLLASIARHETPAGPLMTVMMRDARERSLIAEQLARSEARFSNAFRMNPSGMLLVRADDRTVLEANDALLRMFGYERHEMLGLPARDLRFIEERADARRIVDAIISEGNVIDQFVTFRRKDGSSGHARISGRLIEADDGAMALSIWTDLTEQEAIAAAARSSEARFQRVFELSPYAKLLVRASDGIIVDVNHALTHMLGFPRAHFLGRTSAENGTIVDDAHNRAIWAALRQERTLRDVVVSLRRSDLQVIDVLVSADIVELDGVDHALVVATDLSERHKADAAVAESERRFAELAQSIREVFFLVDPRSQRYLYVSPAFENVWGRSRAQLYADPSVWSESIEPEDRERAFASRAVSEDATDRRVEYRIRRPDGTVAWIRAIAYPVHDETGNTVRIAVVSEDITEHRQAEERLRQSQKMESIGNLAGGVAHDFNNWLTIIASCAEMLAEELPPDGEQAKLVEDIRGASDRAASLTRQLLSFSRREVAEPRLVDLNEIVVDTEKLLRRLLGEDIVVRTRLDPDIDDIRADVGHIGQVLMNLAVNARDAMPAGGLLTIETSQVDLDAAFCDSRPSLTPGRFVRLTVSDTGVGIPADLVGRIFEPFFTTKAAGKGTGLGLAVVHGIVEQSGGCLDVRSELGKGTSFEAHLPAISDAGDETTRGRRLTRRRCTETILLVEDEDSVRRVAAMILEGAGYKVIEAASGHRALQLLETASTAIALLITDVVMPEMNGRQVAEAAVAMRPALKVLFTSGFTEDRVGHHGVLHAEVAFLQKPFSVASLLRKVGEVLDAP